MGTLYVAGQRPGVGATSVISALATVWKQAGRHVAVVKPATLDIDGDSEFYARVFSGPKEASMLIEEHTSDAILTEAITRVKALASDNDVVIVEGLPMSDSHGNPVAASPTLASHLGARVLGIVPYSQKLTVEDATAWRDIYATLSGVVINRRTRYRKHDASTRLIPAFEEAGVSVYGTLPEDRSLLSPTVSQVATLLEGTFYAGASGQDELIEHFMIGGLITEWGGAYFDRYPKQAVIVRGGRMDIQMAALNFPLTCLILTGCESPPQYVQQRAVDLDVPLIISRHDTPQATAMLEEIGAQVTIDHLVKIERVSAMLTATVDVPAIGESLGLYGG